MEIPGCTLQFSDSLKPVSLSLQHVIRAQRAINNEMAHQLYVLQVLTFNLLEDRMMTKMDPQDQVSVWHDLVLAGRQQLLTDVPKALHGGKKHLLGTFTQVILFLCEVGLCFLVVRRCIRYFIPCAKVQNGQAILLVM